MEVCQDFLLEVVITGFGYINLRTSLLVVTPVDPSGIIGKYPWCCGRLNYDPVIIRYTYGHMTSPISTFPPTPRLLWTDPTFIFIFMGFIDVFVCWFPLNFGYDGNWEGGLDLCCI